MQRLDWFDLRNMLTVARAVTQAAALRTESRGAHQREDFPEMLPQWRVNQTIRLRGRKASTSRRRPPLRSRSPRNERHRHPENLARPEQGPRSHWETHAVPFERGQSVLDGLRWIRVNKDPSLAIRFSCINANACKECMMELDGETVYACTARLEPREMTVAPLPNKKLVRDLVTEIAPPAERFAGRKMMTTERKPVAFGDMRNWMKALKSAGELREIDAEVDWNVELGTIMRLAQGPGTGPALLFNNIKDYNKNDQPLRRGVRSALGSYRRVAMMLGLPPDTHPRELVKIGRTIMKAAFRRASSSGPCKENIVTGKDIDLDEFPGRRSGTGSMAAAISSPIRRRRHQGPDTNVMNVGIYRGMVSAKTASRS
jgi:hypothetical protein